MKTEFQISVRALAEIMLKSGDLNLDGFGSIPAIAGIRMHQKIQKSRPPEYTAEVSVKTNIESEFCILKIAGRIDGVFEYPENVIIEEIKTISSKGKSKKEKENPVHWGQAKIYAYLYAKEHDLKQLQIQLTYYDFETEKISEDQRSFTISELEVFFDQLTAQYLEWLEKQIAWQKRRDSSIKKLQFPFQDYRPGQRRMAAEVYRTIRDKNQLIIQAPTGIGKSMAALFSALKAQAEGLTKQIFYLTARTTGKNAAEKALKIMVKNGLEIKSITLTAKEKICLNPGAACSGVECEYARNYYEKINEALQSAFNENSYSREFIESNAFNFKVCPFEFSLDLALLTDCIICDYNYAFDPRVYLRRFFMEGILPTTIMDYTFLIDEAHNLVDRSRAMFSAELTKKSFLDLRRKIKTKLPDVYRKLSNINSWFLQAYHLCEEKGAKFTDNEAPIKLIPKLEKLTSEIEKWLAENIKTNYRDDVLELYFKVINFLRIAEGFDENYAALYENYRKDLRLKLFCINPASKMTENLQRCQSAVFFSATMTPFDYFKNIFGCSDSTRFLIIPCPFPPENLDVIIMDRISTRFRHREQTKEQLTQAIFSMVKSKIGNYLLFFPSYKYMTMIYQIFCDNFPDYNTIIQEPVMSENERDDFLAQFDETGNNPLIGFAVMGGIFGEGIDLVGERLDGAALVGVGLPALTLESELIRQFFDKEKQGYEYAYMYPGINRVFQAAGRVIRTKTDRGVVLLIDDRFNFHQYRCLFPNEWQPKVFHYLFQLRKELQLFWK